MANRIVVADASPLIGLASAGAFDLLRQLYGQITITDIVRDEVLSGGPLPGALELTDALGEGWITVVKAPAGGLFFSSLDAGEASTLNFAIEHSGSCLLLMDDLSGRFHASARGLAVTGVAGVLLAARRQGLVKSIRPLLGKLEENNFRLSRTVVRAVLDEVSED